MAATPARLELLSPRAATVMRLLAVVVVLLVVGCPLGWGVAQVAARDGGVPVVTVHDPGVDPALVDHASR